MEYLLILLAILLTTIFFEINYKIHLYHSLKERLFTSLTILVMGIIWDYYATSMGHWAFPGPGLIGLRIQGLPIEEFLFFLIMPYAILTMYRFYHKKIK